MNPVRAALLFAFLVLCSSCADHAARPNIVLIIIDTLRADHLGCYGYPRGTSPAIDSLAAHGVLCTDVQAQSSWTLPAVTSILSGLDARSHGAGRTGGDVYAANPGVTWLPTIMNDHSYQCLGIFNVYLLSEYFSFHRGFGRFRNDPLGDGQAAAAVDTAMAWLLQADPEKPFFLVLHVFDPHDPYDPPPPYDRLYAPDGTMGLTGWPVSPSGQMDVSPAVSRHLTDLYDGEIAWIDSQMGRLFRGIHDAPFGDNTVIILTADHGEEFLEHGGVGHGRSMYREILHVPLIVSGAGVPGGVVDSLPHAQIDILPTILAFAGIDDATNGGGVPLFGEQPADRIIPASNVNTGEAVHHAAVRSNDRVALWNVDTGTVCEYDLSADPEQLHPLEASSTLVERLEYYWSTPPVLPPVLVERDLIDPILRDLGYI